MLVLTRKRGDKILIGDNIVVTIVNVGRGLVRVGVESPRDVKILREELVNGVPGVREVTNN